MGAVVTDRQVYAAFIVVVLCVFAMLSWTVGQWARADERADEYDRTLTHILTACTQRPEDGSAVCPENTFARITTSTSTSTSTTVVGK